VSADPLGLAEDLAAATARLIETVRRLDDAAVGGPSLLPGWTRGHVLAHLARNADGCVNLLTWARTGVETPQYVSLAQRAADIDAGAGRSSAAQAADIEKTAVRLTEAIAAMPPEAWTATVRWTSGVEAPAARVVWSRLREVELHHVDLGAGYKPADWPEPFSLHMITSLAKDFAGREDGPRALLRSPEVGHDVPLGADSPVITGPAHSVVAWLTGRSTGADLVVEPAGPLPTVPSLG
jgi:maleylpyruvate isomerase